MDTNATAAAGLNNVWENASFVSILKPRLPSIGQRYRASGHSVYQQYNQSNDCQFLPSSLNQGKEMNNENGDGRIDEQVGDVLEANVQNLEEARLGPRAIFGSGSEDGDECANSTNNVGEDGASCYLCTHCGKGYDSEHELDEHLVQVRKSIAGKLGNKRRGTSDSQGMEEGDEFFEETAPEMVSDELEDEDVFAPPLKSHRSSNSAPNIDPSIAPIAISDCQPVTEEPRQIRTRAYSCKFCSKIFDSNSALNVHYTHTHRDKPQYECDLCGRVYGVKRELATHRRLHDGQPTYRCRQCGKEFGTKQLLRKHELWHTGERSHVCPQCGKAFFQKGHLTQHMMIHAGGRPHACHLCQKTFIFKFDLNRHMKIHAERVGNAEESAATEAMPQAELVAKSVSYESRGSSEMENAAAPADSSTAEGGVTPLLVQTLFPAVSSTAGAVASLPMSTVIQQLQQQNSGNHVDQLTAGASSFGLLRAWTPSPGFLDASGTGQEQQHRAALAAAFAQALCQAQQQASLFARFSASSPPISNLFLDDKRYQHSKPDEPQEQKPLAQAIEGENVTAAAAAPEHDNTSGSSPASIDQHRESSSPCEASPPPSCDSCRDYRQRLDASNKRIQDLERDLSLCQAGVDALNSKIHRVADVASRLLESCSDFDKLWMLHSKQVYSQIQNILNALD